jgi:hypothetical protein
MLLRARVPGLINRVLVSRAAIWAHGVVVPKHHNVLAVLATPRGRALFPASNIVTTAGDTYYAQQGAGETPTNAFGITELASAGTPGKAATRATFTMIGATQKAHASGWPRTNDPDADNTGAGATVVSYKAAYAKADFNHAAISHGVITNVAAGASEPLLTGYAFASPFAKTANDTLAVYTNHTLLGA